MKFSEPAIGAVTSRRTSTGAGLIVELRKPRSLNALDLDAFRALDGILDAAECDPTVQFVALWAPLDQNPKAFCAGGDVRRLHDEYRASGSLEHGSEFFRTEYRVDRRIWDFQKPVVALTHGITMGGGIGLIRGARFRVACETSIWAMPEISIGLYPDVGATAFLQALPPVWRNFIALTGARLGIVDVIGLGLATHSTRQQNLPQIVEALEVLPALGREETVAAIEDILSRYHAVAEGRSWQQDWQHLAPLFGSEAPPREAQARWSRQLETESRRLLASPEISHEISPELRVALETFVGGSPASVRLIIEQLNWGSRLGWPSTAARPDLGAVFEWEYKASMKCMAHGDFFEGVRSRLVDKDFRQPGLPRWKHEIPSEIPEDWLKLLFP